MKAIGLKEDENGKNVPIAKPSTVNAKNNQLLIEALFSSRLVPTLSFSRFSKGEGITDLVKYVASDQNWNTQQHCDKKTHRIGRKLATLVPVPEDGEDGEEMNITLTEQLKGLPDEGEDEHIARIMCMLFDTQAFNHVLSSKGKRFRKGSEVVFENIQSSFTTNKNNCSTFLHNFYAISGFHPMLMACGLVYSDYCYLGFYDITVLCAAALMIQKSKNQIAKINEDEI